MKKIVLMLGCLITVGAQISAAEPGTVPRTFTFPNGTVFTTYMSDAELYNLQKKMTDKICKGERFPVAYAAEEYQRLCYYQNKKLSVKGFEECFFKNYYLPFQFTDANKAKIVASKKLGIALLNCRIYHDLQLAADKKFVWKLTAGIASVTAVATQVALSYISSNA
jgi:hypothetical protein